MEKELGGICLNFVLCDDGIEAVDCALVKPEKPGFYVFGQKHEEIKILLGIYKKYVI